MFANCIHRLSTSEIGKETQNLTSFQSFIKNFLGTVGCSFNKPINNFSKKNRLEQIFRRIENKLNDISGMFGIEKNLKSLSVRKGRLLPYIFFQVYFHLFYGFATKTTLEFRKFRKIMTGFFSKQHASILLETIFEKVGGHKKSRC